MNKIPVTFTHNQKQYSGTLSKVQGAGDTSTFHLEIDGYYKGRLRRYNDTWVFDSNSGMEDIAEVLGEYVIAWEG